MASAKAAAELNQLYVLSCSSTYSIEEVVTATGGKGKMMLEIDTRLPPMVVNDLVVRASKHLCFVGIVFNVRYMSDRVTEMEWKQDFVIPPHLKAGTLVKYAWKEPQTLDESEVALRDCYGLLKNQENASSVDKKAFTLYDFMHMRRLVREDMKLVVKGIMNVEDALDAVKSGADAIWVSNGGNMKSAH